MGLTVTSLLKSSRMIGLLMITLTWSTINGQTSHAVSVTSNVFSPDELTITEGDTVVWTNTEGSHNVNGLQSTFPDNPESFGNDVGSGWVFEHVFSIPGTYNYQCDPHAALGMTGIITVQEADATGLGPDKGSIVLQIYPNPAEDVLYIIAEQPVVSVSLISVTGLEVLEESGRSKKREISLEGIPAGVYFVKISTADQYTVIRRIVKQ